MVCHSDRGSGCSRPGRHGMWHKFFWRRSPLAPLQSCWADDPQTGEQLHQRSSRTFVQVLGSTTDFQTWGSSRGTEKPQGIWFWRPVGFDYRTSIGLGKQTLGGRKHNCMCTRTQNKGAVTPQETEADLPVSVQEALVEAWVNSGLPQGQGHWIQQSWEVPLAGISPFEGDHHYPYHSLA